MISRPRPPLFLEGRSGGWAARAALPLGARGGRRGGRRYFSFRASAALREEAEERLRGVDLARRVVLQREVDGRVAADGAARGVVGLGGLALVLEDAEVLRAAAVVLLRVLDLREPFAAVGADAPVLARLGRQVALRRRALVLGEIAPGVLAELARARVVGARGGDLVLEVAQELLAEVADARVADLRLELAARPLRDLPSATASDFFTSTVARRWNPDAAVLGRRRRVLDALRRRRVLVGEVEARVLADLGRKRVRNSQLQRLLSRPISTRFG